MPTTEAQSAFIRRHYHHFAYKDRVDTELAFQKWKLKLAAWYNRKPPIEIYIASSLSNVRNFIIFATYCILIIVVKGRWIWFPLRTDSPSRDETNASRMAGQIKILKSHLIVEIIYDAGGWLYWISKTGEHIRYHGALMAMLLIFAAKMKPAIIMAQLIKA